MAFGRYVMEGAVGWETVFLVGSPLCNPTIFRFSELHPGAVWQWRQDSNFDGEQRAQSSAPCPMIYPGCRLANSIRPAFPKTDTLHRCLPTSPLVCRLLLLLFHGAHRGDAQALMVDALADKRLYEQVFAHFEGIPRCAANHQVLIIIPQILKQVILPLLPHAHDHRREHQHQADKREDHRKHDVRGPREKVVFVPVVMHVGGSGEADFFVFVVEDHGYVFQHCGTELEVVGFLQVCCGGDGERAGVVVLLQVGEGGDF